MKKTILTLLFIAVVMICNAQTSSTKYYKDQWGSKEVPQQKANFSKTITENADGTITKETRDLKSGSIFTSSTYKGDEPVGIWIYQSGHGPDTMKYNFTLDYNVQKCPDSISKPQIKNYFQDDNSVNYKAPVMESGNVSITQFISNHIVYPVKAKEEGIQGEVLMTFTITEKGNIENISITKGVNVLLDKEAVRVVRKIKFSSPPMFNGKPHSVCVTLPVRFVLQ
jgi:TonB family protein